MNRRLSARAARPGHADDWLLTYADAITLLLCLFMAMFSTALVRARHAAVAASHAPPVPIVVASVSRPHAPPAPPIRPFAAVFGTGLPIPNSDMAAPDDDTPAPTAPVRLLAVPRRTPIPAALAARVASAGGEIHQTGDRLTTIRMASETFFPSGSAELSAAGRDILAGVAGQIAQRRFAGYLVTVEGHTDDVPIATALFPSNWELSGARAAAVVRFLAERGVDSSRLRAAGFADSVPIAPDRDASGRAIPENQARNRRVVIRLERVE